MLSRQFKSKAAPLASRYSSTQVSSLSPLVRTYAQVNTEQDSKPPVALFGLDGTYASALVRSLGDSYHLINSFYELLYSPMLTLVALSTLPL